MKIVPRDSRGPGAAGFTLIELLLAVAIFSVVLVAIHGVFRSAIRLRNKTTELLAASIPIQQALGILQRDLANLVVPGGPLSGTLQTTPTTTGSTNATTSMPLSTLRPGQAGPAFFTSVGVIDDRLPWGEVEKVIYRLAEPTNDAAGMDLVRSVTRNLLPPMTEDAEDQFLLQGVERLTFLFHDGQDWREEWDSATETKVLPAAIKVQLLLASSRTNVLDREPIELVVPIQVQPGTSQSAGNATGETAP